MNKPGSDDDAGKTAACLIATPATTLARQYFEKGVVRGLREGGVTLSKAREHCVLRRLRLLISDKELLRLIDTRKPSPALQREAGRAVLQC